MSKKTIKRIHSKLGGKYDIDVDLLQDSESGEYFIKIFSDSNNHGYRGRQDRTISLIEAETQEPEYYIKAIEYINS
jgi:hypothetical protein